MATGGEGGGEIIAQALLRALFGELGDKTFWLTMLLGTWCIWEGVRDGSSLSLQQLLVYLGAMVGLLAHMVMIAVVPAENWAGWKEHCWIFELITGVVCMLLCWRAYVGRSSDGYETEDTETEPLAKKEESPKYRKDAFTFPTFAGAGAEDGGEYGSTADRSYVPTEDGLLGTRISDQTASSVLAFIFTAAMIFVAEAEDKSWNAIVAGGNRGALMVVGAMLGFVPSVFLAAVASRLVWFQLEVRFARFLTMWILIALSLVSFSQALLHLPVIQEYAAPGGAQKVTPPSYSSSSSLGDLASFLFLGR